MSAVNPFGKTCAAVAVAAGAAGLGVPGLAVSATLEIPLALDYRLLQQTLSEQVFTDAGESAEFFADRIKCNHLSLRGPRIDAAGDGLLRLRTTMQAQTGTPLGGRCWLARPWDGQVETIQSVQADPLTSRLTFRVVDSSLVRSEDGEAMLPRFVERGIQDFVHPRLSAVEVDLSPVVSGLRELLALASTASAPPPGKLLAPLELTGVRVEPASLVAILSLEVPEVAVPAEPGSEAPLTPEELAQWDAAWQSWDAFATWAIKTLAQSAGAEFTRALAETLLDARYDLRDALVREDRDRDPVRALFLRTWERLAPLVRDVQLGVPGGEALPYAAFVSAGDALRALDRLAPHVGLGLDQDTLRQMARLLEPGVDDSALRYGTAVDPGLRELLGLEPEFDAVSGGEPSVLSLLFGIISDAQAAQIPPEVLRRLDGWVPERGEVDQYLQTVERLLDGIARAERQRNEVPTEYEALFDTLLRATAWQESCWRQYVLRDGSVETIRSPAGSVGLMQVNLNVWRGVYDPEELIRNVEYNARAGNEILVHYLVDYAIRKGEDKVGNDPDNLARATYAAYNGGPAHLARYRKPGTKPSLKDIDKAFWDKYQAIQAEGAGAVKRCLSG
jgi:hypothetical protein